MTTIKELLKKKYKNLPRKEKEVIGEALLKVNLGLALPVDLKRAAIFLKGTPYIAKKGLLEGLIEYIHSDNESFEEPSKDALKNSVDEILVSRDTLIEGLHEFEEDSEITEKNVLKARDKK